MRTNFQFDCPHCGTRGAGFQVHYQWSHRSSSRQAMLLAVCGVCNNGIIVDSYNTHSNNHGSLVENGVSYPHPNYNIKETWPARLMEIPESLPPNVESFYVQGIENLDAKRWDAAGSMFRKSLDVATKIISPQHKSETLFKRIEKLVSDGLLTDAMGQWSHEIRLDGNDAVHDEEPETEEDAKASQMFSEAFLRYAFTLPTMVEENRKKRLSETEEEPA